MRALVAALGSAALLYRANLVFKSSTSLSATVLDAVDVGERDGLDCFQTLALHTYAVDSLICVLTELAVLPASLVFGVAQTHRRGTGPNIVNDIFVVRRGTALRGIDRDYVDVGLRRPLLYERLYFSVLVEVFFEALECLSIAYNEQKDGNAECEKHSTAEEATHAA